MGSTAMLVAALDGGVTGAQGILPGSLVGRVKWVNITLEVVAPGKPMPLLDAI